MKTIFLTGGKLALICAVAAVALGFVNSVTAPKIEEINKQNLEKALKVVVPEGQPGDEVAVGQGAVASYYPVTREGIISGYILRLTGTGYGGNMNILAGYDLEGRVTAAVLMENEETPGLGKEAENQKYMEKYRGKGGKEPVPVSKKDLPAEAAESISGATVTFSGIGRALSEGSTYVKTKGGSR
ncbi:MAG: FMN-binding protein [Spirochaetales bacterium]|nr:FMN-binding protein [Spirochaetales bacterium]